MSKKKTLLKYYLDPYNKAIGFQITIQDKEIDDYLKVKGKFHASNGWDIMIDNEPEIDVDNKVIFLQGKRSKKDDILYRVRGLGNAKEIKKLISAIDRALEELCKATQSRRHKKPFKFYDQFIVDLEEMDCCDFRNHPNVIIIKR